MPRALSFSVRQTSTLYICWLVCERDSLKSCEWIFAIFWSSGLQDKKRLVGSCGQSGFQFRDVPLFCDGLSSISHSWILASRTRPFAGLRCFKEAILVNLVRGEHSFECFQVVLWIKLEELLCQRILLYLVLRTKESEHWHTHRQQQALVSRS